MAFKLKRHRKKKKKLSKKALFLKKLALMKKRLEKKAKKKIKSVKLNNNKQNDIAKLIVNGENQADLNMGHIASAAGMYRRGRIDNRKQ